MITLVGKPKPVDQLAFLPDGRVVTARKPTDSVFDGVEVWDLSRQERVQVIPTDSTVTGFLWHPGGRWLYAELWSRPDLSRIDLNTGDIRGLQCVAYGQHFPVAASPDGRFVVASVHTKNYPRSPDLKRSDTQDWLICWDHSGRGRPKTHWERQRTLKEWITYHIAFLPAGDRFVTLDSKVWGPRNSQGSQLTVRAIADGKTVQKVTCEGTDQLLSSPDGKWVVTRWGKSITIWRLDDLNHPYRSLVENQDPGWYVASFFGPSLAFHPSGRFLAATSNDATVKLYDTSNWSLANTYTWDVGRMRSVAFSPDGLLAAAGSDTGKVVVWDVDV